MLERIRSFLVVVEEGSVNRAAVRQNLSQPALSRQIQTLEQEVGGSLLERGSWGVRPTDLGHELVRRMEPLLKEFDGALVQVRRMAGGERSELQVGYLGSAAAKYLMPALAVLRKTHPDLKIIHRDLTPAEQLEELEAGNLDIALVGQEGRKRTQDFYSRILRKLGVCVALPDDHALAERSSIALCDLRQERFVGVLEAEVPGRNQWMVQLCRKAGFRPRFIGDSTSITDTFAMVASEKAVSLLPDYFTGPGLPGVRLIRLADTCATWDLIVLRQRGTTSQAAKAMFNALIECAQDAGS